MRALLLERGIVVAQGRQRFEKHLALMLDGDDAAPSTLSPRTPLLIEDVRLEWRELDRRIAALTTEFVAQARGDEAARRLTTVPGIGAINATAVVAAIGTAEAFRRARDLAAWLGLVPRQATTGGKPASSDYQAGQHRPAHDADPRGTGRSPLAPSKAGCRWACGCEG